MEKEVEEEESARDLPVAHEGTPDRLGEERQDIQPARSLLDPVQPHTNTMKRRISPETQARVLGPQLRPWANSRKAWIRAATIAASDA